MMLIPTVNFFTSASGPKTPSIGSVRYNTNSLNVELWDGQNWVVMANRATEERQPELKIEVGSIAGIVYNCIRPYGKPWQDMFQWCEDTMGPCGNKNTWGNMHPGLDDFVMHARWYLREGVFWFKDPEDRVMFVLRWS